MEGPVAICWVDSDSVLLGDLKDSLVLWWSNDPARRHFIVSDVDLNVKTDRRLAMKLSFRSLVCFIKVCGLFCLLLSGMCSWETHCTSCSIWTGGNWSQHHELCFLSLVILQLFHLSSCTVWVWHCWNTRTPTAIKSYLFNKCNKLKSWMYMLYWIFHVWKYVEELPGAYSFAMRPI